MKFRLTRRRKWLLATGGALLLTATPSFALFGIGDIVFDPTSYASLVSQLTTLESQYNMLKNNITHFSAKQQWQTALNRLENLNVASLFGETEGYKVALNSNSPSVSLTRLEERHCFDGQFYDLVSRGTRSEQSAPRGAGHDRNLRRDLAGLPHRSWSIPLDQKPELQRQQLAVFTAVRRWRRLE